MSAVNVKWPNWGSGIRAPTLFISADFLQTGSLGPDLVTDALVCLGGVGKGGILKKSWIFEKTEIKIT